MERAAVLGRLTWHVGEVTDTVRETSRVKSLLLDVPDWPGHLAGQHVDVRLTAEDGYQAVRSYSIGSSPEDHMLEITVEELEDGEVSPFLAEEVRAGDKLEFRGPIGGYFVWDISMGGPLLLIAGGSGIVPLMSMLRHHRHQGSQIPVRLLYSARTAHDVIYRAELDALTGHNGVEVIYTYTRSAPEGWAGYRRRVDAGILREVVWPPEPRPLTYVCGATGFVEAVADSLIQLGFDPARVRTERFGPTGT